MSAGTDRRAQEGTHIVAEVLLFALTVCALVSFDRLFVDDSWVRPLLAAALAAHVTMIAMRRLGRGLLLTGLVGTVLMTLQITWTHYRASASAGLPTGTTRDQFDLDITDAWNLFGEVKAPTEATTGFLVMATVAIWVVAYLSDWAAFRLWSAIESLLPSFAIFVFASFFGVEDNRYGYAGLYLVGVIAFQLVHRILRQSHDVRWLAGMQRAGMGALARAGIVVGVLAATGAVIAGPALPGADNEAIIDLDQTGGSSDGRVVVSPIVDIRGRIVEQANIEAFTVRTDAPAYWRLASLDTFNGQYWGADNTYTRASGDLPDDFEVSADSFVSNQEFEIEALDMVWIPAAFEPQRIVDASGGNISYEPVSGTLIVGSDQSSSNGLSYTIQSAIPTYDPVALAAAGNTYPAEIIERYTGLPDDFSDEVTALAFSIVEGAANDYDRALALQNYFRDNFEYDIDVGAGHSSARIENFLASGRGYCEQFAGSFAAMARALGMPARVAVGFTWGDQDLDDLTLYHVRGEHAHAWPEVYIPGNGWVAFEPTPTRGAPNAAAWTGIPPEQEGGGSGAEPAPTPEVRDELPDDLVAPPVSDTEPVPDGGTVGGDDGGTTIPAWYGTVALALLAAVALFALYTAAVVGAKRLRRTRRFANARDNRQRVQALWSDAVETLRPLGLHIDRAETIQEFTGRVSSVAPEASPDLAGVGALAVEANYGPSDPSDPMVERALSHRDELTTTVQRLATPADRWRDMLDPRPLLKR